jgi:hypothetical protein
MQSTTSSRACAQAQPTLFGRASKPGSNSAELSCQPTVPVTAMRGLDGCVVSIVLRRVELLTPLPRIKSPSMHRFRPRAVGRRIFGMLERHKIEILLKANVARLSGASYVRRSGSRKKSQWQM